jgi:hypothetical protein
VVRTVNNHGHGAQHDRHAELATKPVTHDSSIAARLWNVSEELCGLGTTPQQTELLAANHQHLHA